MFLKLAFLIASLVIAGIVYYFLGLYPAATFLGGVAFVKAYHMMK